MEEDNIVHSYWNCFGHESDEVVGSVYLEYGRMPPFDSMRKIRATIFNTITYILLVAHHQLISFSVKLILERINVSNINDLEFRQIAGKILLFKN